MTAARPVLLIVLAAGIAVAVGALLFQYVGGLQPCELCLAERWPYYGAIAVAAVALAAGERGAVWWVGLLALIFLGSARLAAHHRGVEQHWVPGATPGTGRATRAKTAEGVVELPAQ